MNFVRIILILAIASYAYAAIGFAVVAPASKTSVVVKIGANSYTMTRPWSDIDFFTTLVNDAPAAPFTYMYSVDGVDETFTRTFSSGTQTLNEFYGRAETTKATYQMGFPFNTKQEWTRNMGTNGVYDDDYISTVFISEGYDTDGTADSCFSQNGRNCYGEFTVTIISKYDVGRLVNTSISSKAGYEPKVQMNLYLPSGGYRGRSSYKLRPSAYDPSFIREKIYNDVLESCGCPHQETSHARVYIGHGKPLGLYYLQEITGSWDFIRTQFYGNTWPSSIGKYYECSTGAEFWTSGLNSFKLPDGDTYDKTDLKALINKVDTVDFGSDSAMADFSTNWFDIDYYLRAVAVEYLTGNWDAYLFYTSNFVTYNDNTEGSGGSYKFYFIDQDFDQTFGVNIGANSNLGPYSNSYTTTPYTTFVNKTWSGGAASRRVMFDRLLTNPNIKAKFESILSTIVQYIFNPKALGARITAVKDRINDDVKWDRELGLDRVRQGWNISMGVNPNGEYQSYQWTYQDFTNSFTQSVRGNYGFMPYLTQMADNIRTSSFGGFTYQDPPLSRTINYGTPSSGYVVGTGEISTGSVTSASMTTGTQVTPGNDTQSTTGVAGSDVTTGNGNSAGTTGSNQAQPTTGVAGSDLTTAIINNPDTTTAETTATTVDEDSSSVKTIVSIVLSSMMIALMF